VPSALTPDQFLARLKKQPVPPVCLFVGPEGYYRRLCRKALVEKALPEGEREEGLTQVDLEESSLQAVLDDARSLSLFARDRVIWVSSVELALPRRLVATEESEEGSQKDGGGGLLAYLQEPTPGTALVLECSRFDFSGDDRPKLERVQKYFAAVPVVVEFRPLPAESIRALAQDLAAKRGIRITGAELALLTESVAGDANRLESEIDKLALFLEGKGTVTAEQLRELVPNTAQSTIFYLVNALGKRDRVSALRSLDVLVREGEYLPLALTFLNTQFRLALAAKEARVASVSQAQAFFTKLGVRIWRDRAEQLMTTADAFTAEQLGRALVLIYETDKNFREGYRDDRVIMERLIMRLTENGANASSPKR
jgi:DNA polymerase III subunit delta